MKNRTLLTTLVVSGLSFTMLAGWTCGHGGYGGQMDPQKLSRVVGARVDNVLDDVDATDAQRKQIHVIQDKLIKDGLELRKGNQSSRKELLEQWESANPDKQKVYSIVDARIEDLKTFAHEAADAILDVHGILSPSQRAKLTEQLKEHMQE